MLYGTVQIVTAEARNDLAAEVELDDVIKTNAKNNAIRNGYRPLTEPHIRWRKLTQYDIDHELLAQRAAGIEEPFVWYRVGDWKSSTEFEVEEA